MTKKVLMSCHGTVFPQCNSRSLSFFLIWREKLLSKHFGVQFQLMLDVIKIQSEPLRNNIIEGWLKFWLKGHMPWRPRCLKWKWMCSCGTKNIFNGVLWPQVSNATWFLTEVHRGSGISTVVEHTPAEQNCWGCRFKSHLVPGFFLLFSILSIVCP